MQWFEDARLGMMVHFGLYSTTKGFWDGEEVPFIGEWIQSRFQIPVEEYKNKLAPLMTLNEFNAKDYVDLAVKTGMKYIIFTTKHHEGFALFDSKVSDYTVTKLCTPDRDPMKELADECAKAGIKLCFYYSHSLDWEDKNAFGNDWDYNTDDKNFETFLHGKCMGQLTELLTNYGEVSMIWFDTPRGFKKEWAIEVRAMIKSLQPNCIINGRILSNAFETTPDNERISDYASSGDNEIPYCVLREGVWETTGTHNNTWGYKLNDKNFRTPRELKDTLVALLSVNANYALNIGPNEAGGIPAETVRDFEALGEWVARYSEAIYGTSGSPFDYDVPWGKIATKGNNLYLFVQNKTEDICLTGMATKVLGVYNLDAPETQLEFTQGKNENYDRDELVIKGSFDGSDDIKVIRVELDGKPQAKTGFYQLCDKSIQLFAAQGVLTGTNNKQPAIVDTVGENLDAADAEKDNALVEEDRTIDKNGIVRNWMSADGSLTMDFSVDEAGEYDVYIYTRPKKYEAWSGGHTVRVTVEESSAASVIKADKDYVTPNKRCYDDRISYIGKLNITNAGSKKLVVTLDAYNQEEDSSKNYFKGKVGFGIFRVDLMKSE